MPEILDDPKLEMERQKLEIEGQKLAIERQKLNLEITKAKWATVSIGVPILVVAATIMWDWWHLRRKQGRPSGSKP